jgi:predicted NUDIX family phosphoesterase
MGDFLQSAWHVLADEGRPLSHRELTELALARQYLASDGKTPWQTMKSKLSTDILRKRDQSLFMRTDKGLFGLRAWGVERPEYIADRYQKALLDEDVVVFDSTLLARYLPTPGIHELPPQLGQELLDQCRPMKRSLAEDTPSVVQLVSAFILRFRDRFLTYKRTKRLPESRLHHYYSINFGGHLNPDDVAPLWNIFDPNSGAAFLERELSEEVKLPDHGHRFVYLGVLWDDRADISKQHLGIVYEVEMLSAQYEIGERGFLMDPRLERLDEIEGRIGQFENWSELLARYERQRA